MCRSATDSVAQGLTCRGECSRKPPVSHHGYLVKACPEHLRPATNDEKFILTDYIADNKARGFEPPQGQAPKFRLTGKTKHEDVVFKDSEPRRMRTD